MAVNGNPFLLRNKVILVLSPQAWGKMHVSKHHYSLALAENGNTVYFLNPPDQNNTLPLGRIEVKRGEREGLFLIYHRLFYPYVLKFKWRKAFHFLMRFHLRRVVRKIGKHIDVIWSFDLEHLYPMDFFSKQPVRIFHPVDEPLTPHAIAAAKGADIIFSVTKEILEKYRHLQIPGIFVNHGIAREFCESRESVPLDGRNAGFAGNLLRKDIDRETLLQIIEENPDITFHFWGSYVSSDTNIGGNNDVATRDFIRKLQLHAHVKLHGVIAPGILAEKIHVMDAFLICYDIQKDQSKGTNYHKVMEFLSTGKVIISNNITTYAAYPGLLAMSASRDNNRELPALFREVMANLDVYNSHEQQVQRRSFALENTYQHQLGKIEQAINEHLHA